MCGYTVAGDGGCAWFIGNLCFGSVMDFVGERYYQQEKGLKALDTEVSCSFTCCGCCMVLILGVSYP